MINPRTAAMYRRVLNARASKVLGSTITDLEKGSGQPLCIIAAEREAKRRGITANDVLGEQIAGLNQNIQTWQADPKHPEEGSLPFNVKTRVVECYRCHKPIPSGTLCEQFGRAHINCKEAA